MKVTLGHYAKVTGVGPHYRPCEVCGDPCYFTPRFKNSTKGFWRHTPHYDRPPRPGPPVRLGRTCVVCGIAGTPKNRVHPFGLRHAINTKQENGKWRSEARSSGSIALCRECWEKHAKPQMRPKKSHMRVTSSRSSKPITGSA